MWEYRARLQEVHDGDTLRLLWDLGRHTYGSEDVRLVDVHAPELREPGGPEARDFVQEWCDRATPYLLDHSLQWPLLIRTQLNTNPEPEERRSFTRFLADVWYIDGTRHLNADITEFLAGHPEWGPGS